MTTITKTQTSHLLQREKAIAMVKESFEKGLKASLALSKVSSPVAVLSGTGINDDLNGIERPVSFPIKALGEQKAEVVHSLAKWKRLRLAQLQIPEGEGIITDMRALRPDEDYSSIHSIYVDQFDWEKHISHEARSLETLKKTVLKIYDQLKRTELEVEAEFPEIRAILPEKITFIHSEDLLKEYPDLSPKEREHEACKKYGAVFLIGIGGKLSDGKEHDGRAPDYDDWSSETEHGYKGLNGDILVWHPVLKTAFEISSMGIRVEKEALERQLKIRACEERKEMLFHKLLLAGQLPESIGGGIGQSRLCMYMLKLSHIGEVQVGIWDDKIQSQLKLDGVDLL